MTGPPPLPLPRYRTPRPPAQSTRTLQSTILPDTLPRQIRRRRRGRRSGAGRRKGHKPASDIREENTPVPSSGVDHSSWSDSEPDSSPETTPTAFPPLSTPTPFPPPDHPLHLAGHANDSSDAVARTAHPHSPEAFPANRPSSVSSQHTLEHDLSPVGSLPAHPPMGLSLTPSWMSPILPVPADLPETKLFALDAPDYTEADLGTPRAYNADYPHPLTAYASPAVNPATVRASGHAPLLANLNRESKLGTIIANCGVKDLSAPGLMLDANAKEGCGIPEKFWLRLSAWAAVKVPLGAIMLALHARRFSLDHTALRKSRSEELDQLKSMEPRRASLPDLHRLPHNPVSAFGHQTATPTTAPTTPSTPLTPTLLSGAPSRRASVPFNVLSPVDEAEDEILISRPLKIEPIGAERARFLTMAKSGSVSSSPGVSPTNYGDHYPLRSSSTTSPTSTVTSAGSPETVDGWSKQQLREFVVKNLRRNSVIPPNARSFDNTASEYEDFQRGGHRRHSLSGTCVGQHQPQHQAHGHNSRHDDRHPLFNRTLPLGRESERPPLPPRPAVLPAPILRRPYSTSTPAVPSAATPGLPPSAKQPHHVSAWMLNASCDLAVTGRYQPPSPEPPASYELYSAPSYSQSHTHSYSASVNTTRTPPTPHFVFGRGHFAATDVVTTKTVTATMGAVKITGQSAASPEVPSLEHGSLRAAPPAPPSTPSGLLPLIWRERALPATTLRF